MTRTYAFAAVGAAGAIAAAGILMAQGLPALRFAQQFDRVATYLNLSADQKTQAKAIVSNAFTEAKPLLAELKQDHQSMEQLIKSGTSPQFEQQAQKLADEQSAVLSKLIVIRARTMTQLRAVLTPDQVQKAEQLREFLRPSWGRAVAMHMPMAH